tara:strand:+ start:528 stop:1097 length:570 start_codon:yes stop_codon:yes gene_type:complete
MRIISGKFKKQNIFFPKNTKTRPLKDSVRENIFNILEHSRKFNIQIKNSNVLDLYSGSGSFGFEALSRFASKISFVENDIDAIQNLKKNIKNFKLKNYETSLYEQDVFDFFEDLTLNMKFDIIFIDPPYAEDKFLNLIKIIYKKQILSKNHIIILHREKKSFENFDLEELSILENKVYGRSLIIFFKLN